MSEKKQKAELEGLMPPATQIGEVMPPAAQLEGLTPPPAGKNQLHNWGRLCRPISIMTM